MGVGQVIWACDRPSCIPAGFCLLAKTVSKLDLRRGYPNVQLSSTVCGCEHSCQRLLRNPGSACLSGFCCWEGWKALDKKEGYANTQISAGPGSNWGPCGWKALLVNRCYVCVFPAICQFGKFPVSSNCWKTKLGNVAMTWAASLRTLVSNKSVPLDLDGFIITFQEKRIRQIGP